MGNPARSATDMASEPAQLRVNVREFPPDYAQVVRLTRAGMERVEKREIYAGQGSRAVAVYHMSDDTGDLAPLKLVATASSLCDKPTNRGRGDVYERGETDVNVRNQFQDPTSFLTSNFYVTKVQDGTDEFKYDTNAGAWLHYSEENWYEPVVVPASNRYVSEQESSTGRATGSVLGLVETYLGRKAVSSPYARSSDASILGSEIRPFGNTDLQHTLSLWYNKLSPAERSRELLGVVTIDDLPQLRLQNIEPAGPGSRGNYVFTKLLGTPFVLQSQLGANGRPNGRRWVLFATDEATRVAGSVFNHRLVRDVISAVRSNLPRGDGEVVSELLRRALSQLKGRKDGYGADDDGRDAEARTAAQLIRDVVRSAATATAGGAASPLLTRLQTTVREYEDRCKDVAAMMAANALRQGKNITYALWQSIREGYGMRPDQRLCITGLGSGEEASAVDDDDGESGVSGAEGGVVSGAEGGVSGAEGGVVSGAEGGVSGAEGGVSGAEGGVEGDDDDDGESGAGERGVGAGAGATRPAAAAATDARVDTEDAVVSTGSGAAALSALQFSAGSGSGAGDGAAVTQAVAPAPAASGVANDVSDTGDGTDESVYSDEGESEDGGDEYERYVTDLAAIHSDSAPDAEMALRLLRKGLGLYNYEFFESAELGAAVEQYCSRHGLPESTVIVGTGAASRPEDIRSTLLHRVPVYFGRPRLDMYDAEALPAVLQVPDTTRLPLENPVRLAIAGLVPVFDQSTMAVRGLMGAVHTYGLNFERRMTYDYIRLVKEAKLDMTGATEDAFDMYRMIYTAASTLAEKASVANARLRLPLIGLGAYLTALPQDDRLRVAQVYAHGLLTAFRHAHAPRGRVSATDIYVMYSRDAKFRAIQNQFVKTVIRGAQHFNLPVHVVEGSLFDAGPHVTFNATAPPSRAASNEGAALAVASRKRGRAASTSVGRIAQMMKEYQRDPRAFVDNRGLPTELSEFGFTTTYNYMTDLGDVEQVTEDVMDAARAAAEEEYRLAGAGAGSAVAAGHEHGGDLSLGYVLHGGDLLVLVNAWDSSSFIGNGGSRDPTVDGFFVSGKRNTDFKNASFLQNPWLSRQLLNPRHWKRT